MNYKFILFCVIISAESILSEEQDWYTSTVNPADICISSICQNICVNELQRGQYGSCLNSETCTCYNVKQDCAQSGAQTYVGSCQIQPDCEATCSGYPGSSGAFCMIQGGQGSCYCTLPSQSCGQTTTETTSVFPYPKPYERK